MFNAVIDIILGEVKVCVLESDLNFAKMSYECCYGLYMMNAYEYNAVLIVKN